MDRSAFNDLTNFSNSNYEGNCDQQHFSRTLVNQSRSLAGFNLNQPFYNSHLSQQQHQQQLSNGLNSTLNLILIPLIYHNHQVV